MYPHLGAFESTQIYGTGQDILGTTRHIEFWREDLTRLLEAGITTLRYSIPWHRIERRRGTYDWEWLDEPLRFMEEHGMRPIADPLHHTSFPEWLTGGFLNPDFPTLYEEFVTRICERYPFIRSYTVFNEPLATTIFCSYTGMWYPHYASDRHFVAMALRVARAICTACLALQAHDPTLEFVHVDTAESHQALEPRVLDWVHFLNHRRFLITDLILGRFTREHELYNYLKHNGASDDDLGWLQDHRVNISILGLDYYIHSEMSWFCSPVTHVPAIAAVNPRPVGFAAVSQAYLDRYRLPIMLAETNIRGTVEERIAWLKFMEWECEEVLLAGNDFRGFCWYPSIDTTDWWNACTQATGITDPQGIWSLDPTSLARIETELSRTYSELATGKVTSAQIPEYEFGPDLYTRVRGYAGIAGMRKLALRRIA
jgi:beta-glucosidase/6-phospho-beta-glucosidase/beta-galactosidase